MPSIVRPVPRAAFLSFSPMPTTTLLPMKSRYAILLLSLLSTSLFAQVPTTGLVAYYPFNGTAQDASGNGNHGAAQNGVTFGTDRFGAAGKAANFDGVDDYIDLGSNFNLTQSFSVSFYNSVSSYTSNSNPSLFSSGQPAVNQAFHIMLGNGYYRFAFYGNDMDFNNRLVFLLIYR